MRCWSSRVERNVPAVSLYSGLSETRRNTTNEYFKSKGRGNKVAEIDQRLSRGSFDGTQAGKGKSKSFNMPKIMCQLCGKMGHVAMKCYHRFDITFVDNSHSHKLMILLGISQLKALFLLIKLIKVTCYNFFFFWRD